MTECIKLNGGHNCAGRLSDKVWGEITVENICHSPHAKFANISQMVDFYRDNLKNPTEIWLKSLTENQDKGLWITNFICGEANISRNPANGQFCKNSHQRRRTGDAIKSVREILEKVDFNQFYTFKDILNKVTELKNSDHENKLKWFGELWRYDFSLRYAYHRDIYPEAVYIHAGTAEGLNRLRYLKPDIIIVTDSKLGKVIEDLSSLPKEIADLGGLHIENFLCIFHDHLLRYENYIRGTNGDGGPNYGQYMYSKKEKTKSRESKSVKMRLELEEIYLWAKNGNSFIE